MVCYYDPFGVINTIIMDTIMIPIITIMVSYGPSTRYGMITGPTIIITTVMSTNENIIKG